MGGDEFVIILPVMTPQSVKPRVEQFSRVVINASREISGEDFVSLSVGCAFLPDDGKTPQALLEAADQRMYQAKRFFKLISQGKALPTAYDWHREKVCE